MKEMNWEMAAKELEELLNYGRHEGTRAEVIIQEYGLYIKQATKTNIFYHLEGVVDFCRCKRLSSYVTIIDKEIVCRVY